MKASRSSGRNTRRPDSPLWAFSFPRFAAVRIASLDEGGVGRCGLDVEPPLSRPELESGHDGLRDAVEVMVSESEGNRGHFDLRIVFGSPVVLGSGGRAFCVLVSARLVELGDQVLERVADGGFSVLLFVEPCRLASRCAVGSCRSLTSRPSSQRSKSMWTRPSLFERRLPALPRAEQSVIPDTPRSRGD